MRELWGIINKETGELLFNYRTYQGNAKKCFFRNEKEAIEALKYIGEGFKPCKIIAETPDLLKKES